MPAVIPIDRARRGEASPRRGGEFVLLQVALPGQTPRNAGVLLLDTASGELYTQIRGDWPEVADEADRQVLALLDQDLRLKAGEGGGAELLRSLEDSLSNTVRLTPREAIEVASFPAALERLYAEHVEKEQVQPFITHLPLYSLAAAAGKFGEDREVEAQGWVRVPGRLAEDMFVAHVAGRSMEPRIPDGSLCVFRANVVGSRQGKLLLVERFGTTDTSARYTVKKYTSTRQILGEGEDASWRHASVRLEPLNPEFEGFELREGECRVIAEFVQVLD